MDYSSASVLFKLRKVWRYIRLYGPLRTYVKVLGYLHLQRRFDVIPRNRRTVKPRQQVGLIGCGNYCFSTIAYFLRRELGDVVRACADIDPHRAASLSHRYGIPRHGTDASAVLCDQEIRLVFVASNHASHANYAIDALQQGKDVYIEKPHVTDYQQLDRLLEAIKGSSGRVYLGFNRPRSPLGRTLAAHLASESGPSVHNWFVAGHDLPDDHWYFRASEGGRVLANLCHWTDFLYHLLAPGVFPVQIVPARATRADANVAVSYVFGDGSLAVITFSQMGHAFEGVREHLRAHRGNLLATLEDFRSLQVAIGHERRRFQTRYRDHGHRDNIMCAYRNSVFRQPYDREAELCYIANTAHLFLQTKQALETGVGRDVRPYLAGAPTSTRVIRSGSSLRGALTR